MVVGKDRVAAMRDRGDLDDRVAIGQRVEAGVVAEGPFEDGPGAEIDWRTEAARTASAVRVTQPAHPAAGSNSMRPHSVLTQPSMTISLLAGTRRGTVLQRTIGMPRPFRKPAMSSSLMPGGSGGGGGIGQHALAAEGRWRSASARPAVFHDRQCACAVVMHVPVHGEVCAIEELGAVHADVVARRFGVSRRRGVDRVHPGEGDVATVPASRSRLLGVNVIAHRRRIAVERPALDQRQAREIDLAAIGALHDLLALRARTRLGANAQQRQKLAALAEGIAERSRRRGLRQRGDPGGDRLQSPARPGIPAPSPSADTSRTR